VCGQIGDPDEWGEKKKKLVNVDVMISAIELDVGSVDGEQRPGS